MTTGHLVDNKSLAAHIGKSRSLALREAKAGKYGPTVVVKPARGGLPEHHVTVEGLEAATGKKFKTVNL